MQNNEQLRKQIIQQVQQIEEERFLRYLYKLLCEMLSKQNSS
jgi:hypothetical protein